MTTWLSWRLLFQVSERAFSSAGITISKCQNRLKVDIIKALQFLKCLIHCDIIFCESTSASMEDEVDFNFDLTPEGSPTCMGCAVNDDNFDKDDDMVIT
jgi:hypothetical protein